MKKMTALLAACMMVLTLSSCGTQNTKETEKNPTPVPEESTQNEPASTTQTDSLLSRIDTVTLDGETITGENFAGEKLTVLNVWATWCPPCVAELPHLQEINEAYADQGVKVVGVMQDAVTELMQPDDTTINSGKELLADAGAEYTVVMPDMIILQELISQMQYFPTTFFIDSEGTIVKRVVGSKDANGWRAEIDGVLAEMS